MALGLDSHEEENNFDLETTWSQKKLGGGFKYFPFPPLLAEMIQFDLRIFFKWVGEKPPTRKMTPWIFSRKSTIFFKGLLQQIQTTIVLLMVGLTSSREKTEGN